jgi:HAD superfamily hydrolase (TIGR01548 family)
MGLPKLIVFDMDGVLIDVSRSYRETVRKTARLFFSGSKGFDALPDPLFPLADLTRFKQTGGLNNDWELTSQIISLLFAGGITPNPRLSSNEWMNHAETLRGFDASSLACFLRTSSTPLMDLYAKYGKRSEPFVSECFTGDVGTGNVIKQIFQEVYLGYDLFRTVYGIKPRFTQEEGLIHQETLLMEKSLLEELYQRHILAIATGRPRVEADHPLDQFGLRKYFQLVVTLDDCLQEEEKLLKARGERVSLSKPNPFSLDLIPKRIGQEFRGAYYLGDMPDDMWAARLSQTGYHGLGVSLCSADQEYAEKELLTAGADHIIHHHSDLYPLIG